MFFKRNRYLIGGALILVGLIVGLTISSTFNINNQSIAQVRDVSKESKDFLSQFNSAMAEVAEIVRPVVVNISTERSMDKSRGAMRHFFDDPFLRRFFGEENPFDVPREHKSASLGSGVIVRSDGYILTNNHVIKDAEKIQVTTSDKTTYTGKVIGTDPKTDLAVIKIDAKNLPSVKIGDSDNLKTGELVIAIGSPYGLNQTITMGIVSATGRSNVGIADYEDFIQTDAAINPGNSGGALVNSRGELVGINTAIFSTSGGYQGIGFAIPTNMARSVLDSLITKGKVIRGWLGISIQDLTPELAKHLGFGKAEGVLIADVVEAGPADKAGVKQGDLIVEIDGKKVSNSRELRNHIASTKPGASVVLSIARDTNRIKVSVKVAEFPENVSMAGSKSTGYDNNLKGVNVQNISPQIRERLNLPKRVKGVVVVDVDQESPAYGILRQGDIISEINKKKIEGMDEYKKIVSQLPKDGRILLLLFRDGSHLYIMLE